MTADFDNAMKNMRLLVEQGFTPEQAAVMAAGLQRESGFIKPAATFRWQGARVAAYYARYGVNNGR